MVATAKDQNLHFVLVPWLAQGRILPMIDIAWMLAQRGVTVTVVTTPVNASRIRSTIDNFSNLGLPVHFLTLKFPSAECGLPEGCENMDSVPKELMITFCHANKLLRVPLLDHLRSFATPPSCIISDTAHVWTSDVAAELKTPRFVFNGYSSFTMLSIENLHRYKSYESVSSMTEPFLLPRLPHSIMVNKLQLPRNLGKQATAPEYLDLFQELRNSDLDADGILINSFDDLEPGYPQGLATATRKMVLTIGPMFLSNHSSKDAVARGKESSIGKEQCINWLNSMERNSVIFVSFGSMGVLAHSQLIELGSGLLASGRPFIWVIKEGKQRSEDFENWLNENIEGNSRCLVIRGWAPQLMILSHQAVGAFFTHSGWNSTLEAVSYGVPMITWPMFADQFMNEKLAVEVLEIGVSVGVEKPMNWGSGEEAGVMVRREEVAKAIRSLMENGEERKRKVEVLAKKAEEALEEGRSSHLNLSRLIQHVKHKQ